MLTSVGLTSASVDFANACVDDTKFMIFAISGHGNDKIVINHHFINLKEKV